MHKALFGISELAELFGVSKQAMDQRFRNGYYAGGFPEAAYTISSRRIWTYEQLHEYVHDRYNNHNPEVVQARAKLAQIGQLTMKMDGSV